MKKLFKNRAEMAGLTLILLIVSFRLYGLDGGLVLGEPDEFIHQRVLGNLHNSPWPTYDGIPWLFQMPLYPYLGFFLSFLFSAPYVALRLVSVASSVLLVLATYFFFRAKVSRRVGFWTALFLALSPFSIYISRLALLDATFVSFGLISVYALQLALDRESRTWAWVAGLFLSLALLTKYSALIYLIVAGTVFVFHLLVDNWDGFRRPGFFRVRLVSLLPLLTVVLLCLPVLIILRSYHPYFFKLQLFTSLGFLRDFWRIKGGELSLLTYLKDLPWWLTWPVLVLFWTGLVYLLKNFRSFPVFWLAFLAALVLVVPFRPFYPRYLYPLVPFIVIIAAFGWESLWPQFNLAGRATSLALFLILILPTAVESWAATNHRLVEASGQAVRDFNLKNPWLFANYWPNVLGAAAGTTRSTWISKSVWDGRAFVADLPTSPAEIFEGEGGFVLLEDLYANSRLFIHPEERRRAWEEISQKFRPIKVVDDPAPNFPHFKSRDNRIRIYFRPMKDQNSKL